MGIDSAPETFLVKAVLVDMDGTVVDSHRVVEESWTRIGNEFGIDPEEILGFAHGRPARETFAEFLPHLSQEERDAQQRKMEQSEVDLARLVSGIPGSRGLLNDLEVLGVPWGLVTSAPVPIAAARFEQVGLPWPKVAVTVEDVTAGKPDPEGYTKAIEQLDVDPADAVVFEDVVPGLRAGLGAGAHVVAVGDVDTSELLAAPGAPERVAQVPNLLGVTIRESDEPGVFVLQIPTH